MGEKEITAVIGLIIITFSIVTAFLAIMVTPDFINAYEIIKRIDYLKREIYIKKDKINEAEVEKVIYNANLLDGKEKDIFLGLLEQMTFSKSEYFLKTKEIKYNKNIEILTNKNEKINFDFYFDQECKELFIKTEDGMLAIKTKQLCKYLKSYDENVNWRRISRYNDWKIKISYSVNGFDGYFVKKFDDIWVYTWGDEILISRHNSNFYF